MPDPIWITKEQQRAAYDALGLDPDRWSQTREVRLQPHAVVVERYRRGDRGILVAGGEPIVDTTVIPLA